MSVELEAKKITVATAQKDCEELLVEIVSERRVADEQKKQVSKLQASGTSASYLVLNVRA